MRLKLILGALLCAVLALSLGCGSESSSTDKPANDNGKIYSGEKHKVYLIAKDSLKLNGFWVELEAGCKQKADELRNIDYKCLEPNFEDAALQAELIDKAVAEGAEVILIGPASADKINSSLEKADKAGVKIIYLDDAATYEAIATVRTDSKAAGKIAGETMLKLLQDAGINDGIIGVASDFAESPNLNERIAGFRTAFEGTPYTVAENLYSRPDTKTFKENVAQCTEYVGFFAANINSAFALSEQVVASEMHPVIVTFDTSDAISDMLRNNIIAATVQQNAKKIGQDAMSIAAQVLDGTFTGKNVVQYTEVNVLTKSDVE